MTLRTAFILAVAITRTSFGADSTVTAGAPAALNDTAVQAQQPAIPPDLGQLRIVTDPADAIVVLDSVEKGKTPLTLDSLKPGEHQLQLKKKGYYIKKATVMVEGGKSREVSLQLMKPARLAVNSVPAGAQVLLNGAKVGATPYVNEKQAPGEYALRLDLAGCKSIEASITVKNGGSDSLSYQMEPTAGQPAAVPAKPQPRKPSMAITIASIGVFLVFSLVVLLVEVTK